MKILMITPYLPYPPSSGGQVRSYNLIKQLSKKHEISVFCYIRDEKERQFIPELEKYCKKVVAFKRRKAWSPINIFLAAITSYPFLVSIYLLPSLQREIKKELKDTNYDLIHAETFYVMPNIPETRVPIFLVEQTIEYLVYQRFVHTLPWYFLWFKPMAYYDVRKIKKWERFYWKKAKRLATMSEEDKNFVLRMEPDLFIDVIANGVDVDYFLNYKSKERHTSPTVLFVGQFRWLPNREAAVLLARSIWPAIKREIPNARLKIVGRNPSDEILDLQKITDVSVDGGVDDIREAYSEADVLVAPIKNGRGTKYKILEAMATKTPVVGTKLAVQGINVKNGREVLIAESTEDLANSTIKILRNKKFAKELARNAFNAVSSQYNWTLIAKELGRVYEQVGEK